MPEDIGKTLTRRARDWGAANLRIEQGGKHPRLVGDFGGKSFRPCSTAKIGRSTT